MGSALKPSDVLVLLPAYNEEKNIARTVSGIRALGFPVLVSDDGSKDKTATEAQNAGAEVLTSATNQGKGAALRRGIDYFLDKNFQALVMMDSDGQHLPSELGLFLAALDEGADLVIGNRMGNPAGMPWVRVATNQFMSALLSLAVRQRIPDTQCGYRALKRGALQKMQLHTDHFEIDSEILWEASRSGFKVTSVPIRSVYHSGDSKIHPLKDTLRFIKFLISQIFSKI